MAELSLFERQRLEALTEYEARARSRGFAFIAGVDEAGRGPLAGPVVAAACILPPGLLIEGINDSKQLLPSQRSVLFQQLISTPEIFYAIGVVDALKIDQVNILNATLEAMAMAIAGLAQRPDYLLIDGNRMPPTDIPGEEIIKGDALSLSIAAASILAKEARDRMMQDFHLQWPHYRFDRHKGYGTKEHLIALEKFGPCPIHRKTFEPIKSSVGKEYH
jgi:ribonuclease HII